jgi:hypothetical protein
VAFETIRGESGVDFVGTAAVDALFALNETGAITADGDAGNDTINIANSTGVVGNATVKGGAGNDTIAFTDAAGANVSRLTNSSVNGGAGDDAIATEGTESSVLRGNEADDNFTLRGNYSNSTLNGNSGEDSFAINVVGDANATLTLSNSKILGGTDNDGRMRFDGGNGIAAAINSTINGSKGNDSITIGAVARATNFTVFGGQGNDLITSTNAGADGITYSGDKGDDQINTGAAKDIVNGGDDSDLINAGGDNDTIDAGAGTDRVNDAAGNDISILGDGNDTYNDAAGNDSITGGLGADTYFIDTVGAFNNNYIISAVADSAAATSGTSRTFDTFRTGNTAALQHIDITPVGEALLGDAVSGTTVVNGSGQLSVAGDAAVATNAIPVGTTVSNYVQNSVTTGVVAGGVAATTVTALGTITATADNLVALNAAIAGSTGNGAVALAATDIAYFDQNGVYVGAVTNDGDGSFSINAADAGAGFSALTLTAAATSSAIDQDTTVAAQATLTNSTVTSFAALRSALSDGNTLTASGGRTAGVLNNVVNYNVITVNDGLATAGIDGTYLIVNNTNRILDSGDLMFRIGNGAAATTTATAAVELAADINQFGIFNSTESASAFII